MLSIRPFVMGFSLIFLFFALPGSTQRKAKTLSDAVFEGDLNAVKTFVAQGADINWEQGLSIHPAHGCCYS
jgi:hypothetical protein